MTRSSSAGVTRRRFHVSSGWLLGSGAMVMSLAAAENAERDAEQRAENPEPGGTEDAACDFQASFMTWDFPYRKDPRPYARHNTPHGNMARIQLDALIDVIDVPSGTSQRFVLIAPCRTEWVYAPDRLFQIPSREYRNIYSLQEQRSMGRGIQLEAGPARGGPVSGSFRSLKIDVVTHPHTRRLATPAEIVRATAANLPLVARTAIHHPSGNTRYLLEYPIRTMNFQPKTDSFQVDTGPLLVPDFASQAKKAIDQLEMAHVAYNRLDRAEFILRRPTPITDESGKELCQVLHYSEVREDRAENRMFAGDRPQR